VGVIRLTTNWGIVRVVKFGIIGALITGGFGGISGQHDNKGVVVLLVVGGILLDELLLDELLLDELLLDELLLDELLLVVGGIVVGGILLDELLLLVVGVGVVVGPLVVILHYFIM